MPTGLLVRARLSVFAAYSTRPRWKRARSQVAPLVPRTLSQALSSRGEAKTLWLRLIAVLCKHMCV
jgi:hypothetical protein